jgi:hypothetical protein
MTTITIERELLEDVVEIFDSAISARFPHEILRDIRAALAAPATAPAQPEIVDLLAEMYELILANKVVLAEKSGGVWTWPDRAIEAVRKHRSGPAQPERKPTTREAFEAWDRKVFALPDRYYTPLYQGDFPSIDVKARWRTWQAATAAAPTWHDAPTVQGVWICDEGDICYTWTAHNIEILDQFDPGDGLRWYGPIPEDRQ